MEVPDLEVLVLNLMSKACTLPGFLAGNPKLKILNITNNGVYPTLFNNFHFLTSSHNLTRIRLEHVDISPYILSHINLQKVSFIMCKIGNTFKELITNTQNIWPQLVEIEIDDCQDLVEFPWGLCSSVDLKSISITNCNKICGSSEEFGDLINLERLSLRSCTKLEQLPEPIWRLEKLAVLDISDCLRLSGLPEKLGKLGDLRMIYMKGCTGVHELPESVKELSHLCVVCNEKIAYQWRKYNNVEINLVEEDRLETLMKIDDNKLKRQKCGWRVPSLQSGIVGFDEPLENLKAKVVADIDIDHPEVLVVTGAGGCGKTTLVKMLCHDHEIREKFGENIFFVTVSEAPNFMLIVNDFFNPNSSILQVLFQGYEDAKSKLEYFLNEKESGPMLLVLDDVWSDSFIKNFPSKKRKCKILVTSRTAFPRYNVFWLDPLNEKDAKTLFCQSAFAKGGRKNPSPVIDENLVNQMVTCCEKHPLTLSVVGRSLNGKCESVWQSMLEKLSQGRSVLDLNKDPLIGLERCFEALDDEFKQCFLDFGVFPEDQRVPVNALLNMWVHLYNHEDDGVDTLAKIFELSYRNLVDLMPTDFRNDLGAMVTFCDQQFVTQHDLLRKLAIHLNSRLPVAQRRRLIIKAQGENMPASIVEVQEPMQARVLSISTGESFSSQWCNMIVPDVEVLVLNFISKGYTLPHFLEEMHKLKILNVINHGIYPMNIGNFHLLRCSYSLTSIRLERVAISKPILGLVNLEKASFIMCKIDNAFVSPDLETLPRLQELEIDNCGDLVELPWILCTSLRLKKVKITNCIQMSGLPEEFANLMSLETLCLRSCINLLELPESISKLQKLSILDISDCLRLSKLPDQIGKLCGLRVIYMKGCTGLPDQLPPSVKDLSHTYVVCDEEISYQWREFRNVEIHLVAED